ncbi:YdcF family protein [Carnobacterium maltaromaticum]
MIILSFFDLNALFPSYVVAIISFIYLVIFYFFFIFVNFLVASLVYQLYRPRLNKHFVIVLGSGLIDGHIVPPLLANRIKKALAFYDRQAAKTSPPKIIFSGGRGDDEKLAESVAMRAYAIEHGLPADDALIEDRSVNTLQNMLYSKEIMDTRMKGQKYKVIFSTNNFHLFRAGIYAKKAGLNAQGIGAKTAFYFWPNAMIREFIAIIVMHKKFHLLLIGSMALVGILLQLALWYSNTH